MSSWPRLLQGLLLALVVFLAVVYLGSAASLPPTDNQLPEIDEQTLPERPIPTRRPGIQLVLGDIECEDGTVAVNFLVLRLPDLATPTAHGHVEYKVKMDGQAEITATAEFVRQIGPVGRYVGHLNGGAGRYAVTEASIEIDGVTAQLVNPHAVEVRCRPGDDRTPRPTETAGPTRTPRPTEPREPTHTPRPTEPPRPTRTPEPTRTPRAAELRLDGIVCEDGRLQLHFVAGRLPEGTTAASLAGTQVDYTLQILTLSPSPTTVTGHAAFRGLDGGIAHYVGVYPGSGTPQDGIYVVTTATLTLGTDILSLPFPSFPAVIRGCGARPGPEPTRTPRPTETTGPTRTPRPTEPPRPTRTPEPTRTPRAADLRLDGIMCEDGHLQLHFVAGRLPEGTTADQLTNTKVSYTLQIATLGQPTTVTGEATFRSLNEGIAHYVGVYPTTGSPQDGIYLVTAATLTIGTDTLSLPFPSLPIAIRGCGGRPGPEPTRTPTVTPTATLKPSGD